MIDKNGPAILEMDRVRRSPGREHNSRYHEHESSDTKPH
jgi:hypothetical protein